MSSTGMKIVIAYLVGVATILLYEDFKIAGDTAAIRDAVVEDSLTKGTTDPASHDCACDDTRRYSVSRPEDSQNYPIKTVPECQAMVRAGMPPPTPGGREEEAVRGAWISKLTLDLIFCHMPDANGVYVYKGKNEGDPADDVFVIEGARTDKINSIDDGLSTMYYSRSVCPLICGACGD